MHQVPSSQRSRITQVVLVLLIFTAVLVIVDALTNPPIAQQPGAAAAPPTPTVNDVQRNATKTAQEVVVQEQAAAVRQTPEPSMTDVARKQPSQPQSAAPESAVFRTIPGGMPAGAGAIVDVPPPFSNSQYHIENSWYLDSDGGTKRIFLYAGNVSGQGGVISDQGVVIVQSLQYSVVDGAPSLKVVETHEYTNTVGSGSLHVTGALGNLVILQSNKGSTVAFDLTARTFKTQ